MVFGHAGAAASGLVVWVSFLSSGWDPLAWFDVLLVATAITFGICMVTLWTPYPIRPEPRAEGAAALATASQPARADITFGTAGAEPQAESAEHPDAFKVTDEMIARLFAEPVGVRRRRRLPLLPLIPACRGFAALATFMLATLAALSARLRAPARHPRLGDSLTYRAGLGSWQKR